MSLKYIGTGFVINIPARDLSAAEVEEFGAQLHKELNKEDPRYKLSNIDLLLSTGLYAQEEAPAPTKNKKKEGDL